MIEKSRLVGRTPRGTPVVITFIGPAEKYLIGPAAEHHFASRPQRPTAAGFGKAYRRLRRFPQLH
jgi:hypothetical protein